MTSDLASTLRWAHQANAVRYEKLLRTHLTDHERRFVQRRLSEERDALRQLAEGTLLSAAPAGTRSVTDRG
jgi:hypothetical protein